MLELNGLLEKLARRPLEGDERHLIHFQGTPATLRLDLPDLLSLGAILRDGCNCARQLSAAEAGLPESETAPEWVN